MKKVKQDIYYIPYKLIIALAYCWTIDFSNGDVVKSDDTLNKAIHP